MFLKDSESTLDFLPDHVFKLHFRSVFVVMCGIRFHVFAGCTEYVLTFGSVLPAKLKALFQMLRFSFEEETSADLGETIITFLKFMLPFANFTLEPNIVVLFLQCRPIQ